MQTPEPLVFRAREHSPRLALGSRASENLRVLESQDDLVAALAELVAIRSVSPDPSCAGEVVRAAEWVAERIRAIGGSCSVMLSHDGVPLTVGEVEASSGRRRARDVLVYAHIDVQPAGDVETWESPPFELTVRGDRLVGRGAADDKANVVIMLAAVEQLVREGALPTNVRFLVDAEEEVGGDTADEWLLADERGASVALMLDGTVDHLAVGIRGLMHGTVAITTGTSEQHSGLYGGAALAATDALIRTLACLLPGDDGLLPGQLRAGVPEPFDLERETWSKLQSGAELLVEAGLRPADGRAGDAFHRRTRAEPALTILGVASGHTPDYAATIPVYAEATISLRPVGGQSAERLAREVESMLRAACPPPATLELDWRFLYDGAAIPMDTAELTLAADVIERHIGSRPAMLRSSGGLPLFETLGRRGIPVISTGFGIGHDANMHGPNENFPRAHLTRGVAAVRELLTRLG